MLNTIEPTNQEYWNIPLWCVHGHKSHPSIHCLMIVSCRDGSINVWGYSVYKRAPGFRTLGMSLEAFAKDKTICYYFSTKQAALDYLSDILEPKGNWK